MPVIRSITASQKCEYDECSKDATELVYSRARRAVMLLCNQHAKRVVDDGEPEYIADCPNCGCWFGVN